MKKKILILEDELLIAKMYSLLFEKEGFTVSVSDHARDIGNLVNRFEPDYIIMDNYLKNKESGFEAASELRKMGIQTPILFTTGGAENVTREFSDKVSNSSYMIKPIEGKELLHFVMGRLQSI